MVLLTAQSQAELPMSRLIKPMKKYHHSGEINFEVRDKRAVLDGIIAHHRKTPNVRIDTRDGVTVELEKYWFNVRPSNTEPKLRLNLEANTNALMKRMLRDVTKLISGPAKK